MIISALHTVSSEHINILFEDGTVFVRTVGREEGDPFGGENEEL